MKLLPVKCAKHSKQDTDCSRKERLGKWSNIPLEVQTAQAPPSYPTGHSELHFIHHLTHYNSFLTKSHEFSLFPCMISFLVRTTLERIRHTGLPVIVLKQTSNTIQEYSVCYSASHVPQSLPRASPLPCGLQALIKLSLSNISNHMKHPRVCTGRSLLPVQQGKGKTPTLLRLLRKSSSRKLFSLA